MYNRVTNKNHIMKYIIIAAVLGMSLVSCSLSKKTTNKPKNEDNKPVSEISQRIFDAIKELDQNALSTAVEGRFGGIKAKTADLVDTVINKVKGQLDEIPQLIWDDYKNFTLEHKGDPKSAVYVYKLPPITAELAQLQANEAKTQADEAKKNGTKNTTTTAPERGQLIVLSAATQNFTNTAGQRFMKLFTDMRADFKKRLETETSYEKVEKEILENAKLNVRTIFKDYYQKLLTERINKL